jgi:hypothetical protein
VLLWLRFLRGTEEGKDKGNSMAFCGWGGLVEKETRRGGSGWTWMREGWGLAPARHERGGGGRRSMWCYRSIQRQGRGWDVGAWDPDTVMGGGGLF